MSSAINSNNLANAIKRGSEKGDLNLPKGIGGRVKMPAKVSRSNGDWDLSLTEVAEDRRYW